ncbi:MAG TPA: transposase [Tepidisphaeraceae bacterium]|jgi:transposase|nr:transposase [Tepidisphaeraceae bacterium]
MALGKRTPVQQPLFINTADLNIRPHPFYETVNRVLESHHFDAYAEELCAKFYSDEGRPGVPPGIYFRCLLLGYFEGIDSERGIDWRCNDSNSLKLFLGVPCDKPAPDHSTLSRTRRLIDLETHAEMFGYVLKILANHDLIDGKTVGVDSTTLEANAAMRSIVRRDSGEGYQEFLTRLAKESGIETPTREDLAKLDKKRKNKASNDDWQSPADPDARIAKMKDGTTHLAHKAEHAVDMSEKGHGVILAVNVCDAAVGDTATLADTLLLATENLAALKDDPRVTDKVSDDFASEAVLDKGYHSKQTLLDLEEAGTRSYASEPARAPQKWDGQADAQAAVYANRRRIEGNRGKKLLRGRGEKLERTFAHCYETGAMRHLYLRGRENIAKRVLIHAAGCNIGIMMRVKYGLRKPRSQSRGGFALFFALYRLLMGSMGLFRAILNGASKIPDGSRIFPLSGRWSSSPAAA